MRVRVLVFGLVAVLAAGCGESPKEAWDLVFFSDSGGWGVAERYAELASEELGREVRVHDYAVPSQSVAEVLALVTGDAAETVAASEIVVVYGNPFGAGADRVTSAEVGGACMNGMNEFDDPPAPVTTADWQPYADMLGQVYDEVWQLRDGKPTVLRAIDLYAPVLAEWRAAGIEEECTALWEMQSGVMRSTAVANGATMVSPYDLLNGADHDQDAVAAGYVNARGIHTTDAGRDVVAAALDATGYEPSTPPGS